MRGRKLAVLFILLFTITLPLYPGLNKAHALNVTWSTFAQFNNNTGYSFQPYIIQTKDTNVWVFYEFANASTPQYPDIFYRTYTWPQWSAGNLQAAPDNVLVANTSQDIAPSSAQLPNGTLYVSFSSNRAGNFDIYLKKYNPSTGWSADYQVTTNTADEKVSSLVAASDGTLWIFWDRQFPTYSNIYYKTYKNGAWSAEAPLTNDLVPIENWGPSATQTRDGKIWVTWQRVLDDHFKNVFIFYTTWNGSSWAAITEKTNTSNNDSNPAIIQDANLTIWMFWSRELSATCTGNGCFQKDIFYSYSMDNGASWSSEAQLTNDQFCSYDNSPPNCFDDIQASVAQLRDFKLWVFWASNRGSSDFWGITYASSNAFLAHDVAVTSISATPLVLRRGGTVTVSVTVADPGAYTETFTVNVLATNTTSTTIATRTYTLSSGASQSFTIVWNTSRVNPARYKISASIPPVSGEVVGNQANNSMSAGTAHVASPGDVNYDGKVDIIDASLLAYAFGTKPGDPKWNPNADLNGDGKVNIIDAAILGYWFGSTG